MTFVGLDGFSKGWVAVTIDGDRRDICFLENISRLSDLTFSRAAIDMPIGLRDDGKRDCDDLARHALRPHTSRVFSGARRRLFLHTSHAEANCDLDQRGQTKISIQLWGIVKKIREVDAFVLANSKLDIRETHPELTFLRLNNGEPLYSKHTDQGRTRRRELLLQDGFDDIDDWLNSRRIGKGAKRDDVLDACAAAIAARDCAGCLPAGKPPRDAHDLPMQIWF